MTGPIPYRSARTPTGWSLPGNARLAVWVVPNVEFFPLDAPVPGGSGAVPDVPAFAVRDYGARVGFWRVLDALTEVDVPVTAAVNGDHRPVMVIGREKPEWLPEDVPLISEIEATEEQAALIEPQVALMEMGRPLVAPPGMDEDLTSCLRDALEATLQNEDLVAEAEQQERPINYLSGDEVEGLVQELLDAPEEYQELLTTFFAN